MEAVFSRDVRGLFAAGSSQKSFYHPSPTTPRAKGDAKYIKKTSVAASTLNKAHRQPPPLKPLTGSSPPSQLAMWDLKQYPPDPQDHLGGIGMADLSSGGSSKFNESWPSKSGDDRGCGFGATDPSPEGLTEEQSCTVSKSSSQESTLARYIERFRQAPPTNRASREVPGSPFWWKQQLDTSALATPPQDTSTPNTARAMGHLGADSDHTHTDPSPGVSPGLDSRCQSVVEKAAELFTSSASSDSPPAQKYLNTLHGAQGKQGLHPQHPRLAAGLWQQEDIGTHPLSPGDDILVQWRLRRKLEQARSETALGLNMSRHTGHVGGREGHSEGVTRHAANIGPVSMITCCAGHAAEDEGLCGRGLARTCPLCQRVGGRGQDQQVQTSPGLLNREQEVCGEMEKDGTSQSQVRQVAMERGGLSGGGSGLSRGGSGLSGGRRDLSVHIGSPRLAGHPPNKHSVAQTQAGVQPARTSDPAYSGEEEDAEHQTNVVTPAPQTSHSSSETSFSLESITESAAMGPEAPPVHGGLALRDLTLSSDGEDMQSIMTFNTEKDDAGMEGMEKRSIGMERGNMGMERDNMGIGQGNPSSDRGNTVMDNCNTATLQHLSQATSTPTKGCHEPGTPCLNEEGSSPTATMQHHSQATSTPTKGCHELETPCLNEEGSPLALPPTRCAPEQREVVTSKLLRAPLQKNDMVESSAETGFPSLPWDYDMDDELLELLITKARLFEAQIREIDGWLMELQGREQ